MTIGHNSMDGQMLLQYIDRIEKLQEAKDMVALDIKEVLMDSKMNGFENKILKQIIKLRRMSAEDRDEQDALLELYKQAAGMIPQQTDEDI